MQPQLEQGSVTPKVISDLELKCRELEHQLQTQIWGTAATVGNRVTEFADNSRPRAYHSTVPTTPTNPGPPVSTIMSQKMKEKCNILYGQGLETLMNPKRLIDISCDVKLNVGDKNISLGDVTIEQWGFARRDNSGAWFLERQRISVVFMAGCVSWICQADC